MKMLKNIVRLLALTSLSLSFTPLTTTKAANAPIAVQKSIVTSLQSNNTPVAESDTVATTDDTTTASADDPNPTSTVSVNVLSGILTLQAVPDFNFGTMMQGSTNKLKSNVTDTTGYNATDKTKPITAGADGNSAGLLEMIDSRNLTKSMPGFTLTASIGKLKTIDTDNSADLDAILYLNPVNLLNGDNENISNSSTDLKTLATSTSSETDTTGTVIDLKAGSYNGGLIKANFNTPDSASLYIPGSNSGTEKSAKNMNAIVTWTLTAKPSVTTN